MKQILIKFFSDLFPVSIGVFLALAVNNWNQVNQLESQKNDFLVVLKSELEMNKSRLENSKRYHQTLRNDLDSLFRLNNEANIISKKFNEINMGKGMILHHWNGPGFALINDASYDILMVTRVLSSDDMELLHDISSLNKILEKYGELSKTILNEIIEINYDSNAGNLIKIFNFLTSDILGFEISLIEKIESLLLKVNERINAH